jgi:hypothetical protein
VQSFLFVLNMPFFCILLVNPLFMTFFSLFRNFIYCVFNDYWAAGRRERGGVLG